MTGEVNNAETRFISNEFGNGLFATEDLEAGDYVLRVKNPFLLIPRNDVLPTLCYGCLVETTDLKNCSGCKTVRYCSKGCQSESWRDVHRLECKVFRKCTIEGRPTLPTPVRGLIQALATHPCGTESDPIWSHLENKKKSFIADQEIWQDVQLQATAAIKYLGLSMNMMDVATSLFCAFKINAFNATEHDDTPIGLCFDPSFATANHSCVANTLISFDGRAVSFKALRTIRRGQEVTLQYIYSNQPLDVRRRLLGERYFFTCTCPKCLGNWNTYTTFLNNPCRDANELSILRNSKSVETEALNASAGNIARLTQKFEEIEGICSEAEADKSTKEKHLKLRHALNLLKEIHCGPVLAAAPYPTILCSLLNNYAYGDEIEAALVTALICVFHIHPFEYPEPWHPIRIGGLRNVTVLISQILSAPKYSLQRLQALSSSAQASGTDLFSCECAVLLLIAYYAPRSHGSSSRFLKGVQEDLVDIERYARDAQNVDCLTMLKMGIRDGAGGHIATKYFRQLESLADIDLMGRVVDSVDCAGRGHNEAFKPS